MALAVALVFGGGAVVGAAAVTFVGRRTAPAAPHRTSPIRPTPPHAVPPPRDQPQHDLPQPAPPQPAPPQPAPPAPPRDEQPALGISEPPRELRIGVLGPLTINGQPGALLPAQSQLLVVLAVNAPGGLSNRQLCGLLGADRDHPRPPDSLRQLIVRTRRQLGCADDGREWIVHLGHGQYALHPDASSDWAAFAAARASARQPTRDSADCASDVEGVPDTPGPLTAALALVRGQPFADCFYWWLDEALIEACRGSIVAAAQELADLQLAADDPAAAVRAARTGLAADDSTEGLWRTLMRAEHAAGNRAGIEEAWHRCRGAIADIAADGEPEPATRALYQELLAR